MAVIKEALAIFCDEDSFLQNSPEFMIVPMLARLYREDEWMEGLPVTKIMGDNFGFQLAAEEKELRSWELEIRVAKNKKRG